jgi:mono/diheme cytochrome c family protein
MHARPSGKPGRSISIAWLAALSWSSLCVADEPSAGTEAAKIDYARQVKPLLTRHCVACHGAARMRAGLRLDTAAAALKGGKSGPVIQPGRGEESPLILAMHGEGSGERMPLNRPPLGVADITLLRDWIDQGAKGMADEPPGVPPAAVHWAFVPPRRPEVPDVRDKTWVRNPVDRFVVARLEQGGLSPSPEAEAAVLLRRASLDLVGLPPTPEEVGRFLADPSPDRYERAIDRLMASPHFGERWARPWLDQDRYADSNGYSIDAPRSIWKYRDWVISAFNADMPYDRFVIDQIAGDLQPESAQAARIATGFHRNTPINQEGGIDVEQFRDESIVDRVNTTGTVFLGLTVGCAQCHDHKYDPISQRDYYRLFAFFNNVDEPEMEISTPSETARRREVRDRLDRFHRDLARRYPDLDERERRWEEMLPPASRTNVEIEAKLAFDAPRDKRSTAHRRILVELMIAADPAFQAERAVLKGLRAVEPKRVTTMVVRERSGRPRETFVHLGGDFTRKGDRVEPGVPTVLPALEGDSPGHRPDRMDLARWLVDRRNPLTARVAVNRIWQAYFGRGLVETDNDFGSQGTPPSHPELLDWLACELIDSGWSLKAIHRRIVESSTYRQASRVRPEGDAVDPDNRLLWRQSRLRLDAELIRDAALASSGLLTRIVGGPSVFPPQPDGVMDLGQMRRPWRPDTGPDRYRRGLYTFFWRATPFAFLATFDGPGGVQTCTRRLRSNTPLQALTLLNDPAFVEIARGLAARILADCPPPSSDGQRIDHAFRVCLGRPPLDRERRAVEDFLKAERSGAPGSPPPSEGPPDWIGVARILLNLDEFVTRE